MRKKCLAASTISLTAARRDAEFALEKIFECDVVLQSLTHLSATNGQNSAAVPYVSIYINSSCPHLQVVSRCHIIASNMCACKPAARVVPRDLTSLLQRRPDTMWQGLRGQSL